MVNVWKLNNYSLTVEFLLIATFYRGEGFCGSSCQIISQGDSSLCKFSTDYTSHRAISPRCACASRRQWGCCAHIMRATCCYMLPRIRGTGGRVPIYYNTTIYSYRHHVRSEELAYIVQSAIIPKPAIVIRKYYLPGTSIVLIG